MFHSYYFYQVGLDRGNALDPQRQLDPLGKITNDQCGLSTCVQVSSLGWRFCFSYDKNSERSCRPSVGDIVSVFPFPTAGPLHGWTVNCMSPPFRGPGNPGPRSGCPLCSANNPVPRGCILSRPQTSNLVPGIALLWAEEVFGCCWCQQSVQGWVIPLSFPMTDTNADKPEVQTEEDTNSQDCGYTQGGVEVSPSCSRGCLRPISEASD